MSENNSEKIGEIVDNLDKSGQGKGEGEHPHAPLPKGFDSIREALIRPQVEYVSIKNAKFLSEDAHDAIQREEIESILLKAIQDKKINLAAFNTSVSILDGDETKRPLKIEFNSKNERYEYIAAALFEANKLHYIPAIYKNEKKRLPQDEIEKKRRLSPDGLTVDEYYDSQKLVAKRLPGIGWCMPIPKNLDWIKLEEAKLIISSDSDHDFYIPVDRDYSDMVDTENND